MTGETVVRLLAADVPREDVVVEGWVITARQGKGVAFFQVGDGSSMDGLQVVVGEEADCFGHLSGVTTGAAVRATGKLVESPAKGQRVELQAADLTVVGPVAEGYPLQKKRHSFEFLRTIAHLRPRSRTFGAVFRVRHALQRAIHRFFDRVPR